MQGIWQELLKFWQDSPGLAWSGLIFTIVSLWAIVVKTVRDKLTEWLQSWLVAVIEPWDQAFKTQMARRFSLRAYCRLLLANDQFRYLFVPGATENDSRLDVDRAFVTLRLENTSKAGQQWFNHQNLLELGKRVRVVGDPGSGKSSLVKRMLRDACEAALLNATTARLPVLLELGRLKLPAGVEDSAKFGQWLFDEVKQQVTQYNTFHKPAECFDAYFAGPGLLVLLDGLDEVASAHYPHMREALHGLSQKLAANPNNRVVLTMRSQFHQQVKDDFREDGSQVVKVQAFSPSDIYHFLQRWPFRDQNERKARDTRIRIYRELTERVSLREMCSNPLVLSMYVAKDYGLNAGSLPSSRTWFYKQVIGELLVRRSFRQGAALHTGGAESLRDQREQILGTLALQHMLELGQGANHLSWRTAIDLVKQIMQCDEARAIQHFDELAKDTGLIVAVQKRESFRFVHLTFCEYFAALGACNWVTDGWLNLLSKHAALQEASPEGSKNRLVEVVPFAFGLMKETDRPERLGKLLPSADASLLARTFLECKLYNHGGWAGFIEHWKNTLLATPEQAWGEAWLADLHLFSVVVTDARQNQDVMGGIQAVPDLEAIFLDLASQNRTGLGKLLHAYARLDAQALFSLAELNKIDLLADFPDVVLVNCDQPMFLEAILHKALADPARSKQWAALFAEAGLRSTAVAEQLAQMPMENNWQALADATPKAARWHNNRFMPDCLYSQCLSIACTQEGPPDSRLKVLQILRTVPAPGGYRLLTSGTWLLLLEGFAVLVAGLALWDWWLERIPASGAMAIGSIMGFYCLVAYWLKQYRTIHFFQVASCMLRTPPAVTMRLRILPMLGELLSCQRLGQWRDMNRVQKAAGGLVAFASVMCICSLINLNVIDKSVGLQTLALGAALGLALVLVLGLRLWLGLAPVLMVELGLVIVLGSEVGLGLVLAGGMVLVMFLMSAWEQVLDRHSLKFGLDAIVPASIYWGKKMASASEALQETRRALGINPP